MYPMKGWEIHRESGQGIKGGIPRTVSRVRNAKQDIRATSFCMVDQLCSKKEGPHCIKNGKQILVEDT